MGIVGRPRKEVPQDELEKLCAIQCTADEICGFYGIHLDTLNARVKEWGYANFSDYFKKHSQAGKVSLRRAQYKNALNGSVPMQIWLGKQVLGQSENSFDAHGVGGFAIVMKGYDPSKPIPAKEVTNGAIEGKADDVASEVQRDEDVSS